MARGELNERGGGRPRRGGLRAGALGCAAGIALSAAALAVLTWPTSEVVYRDHDASTTTYSDASGHYVGLVRESSLAGHRSYRVVAGRAPGLDYGHSVDIGQVPGASGVASTSWSTSGVRLRFRSGHTLFVPARYVEGGR